MDLRKVAFSDQLPSKKVVFGFRFGVVACVLIFALVLMINSFHVSFFNPIFQGLSANATGSSPLSWFFPQPTVGTATTFSSGSVDLVRGKEEKGVDKAHVGNFSEEADKGSSLSVKGRERERPNLGNLPNNSKNLSFFNSGGDGNSSEKGEKGSILGREERVTEKTHEGPLNSSTRSTNATVSVQEGGISEKVQEINSSVLSFGGKVVEMTNEGVHKKNKNASFSAKEERVRNETHLGNLSEIEKNATANFSNHSASVKRERGVSGKCDIFSGRWVRDESKPYYPAGSCPHIDKDFNCYENGRPDDDFLRWRWQPNDCDIPSLNATDFLERLRGKRLLFVGDSLNRNMWESLVCILRHVIVNKNRVREISGKKEFKTKGYYSFKYEDYNCSIDFVRSPFLVRESTVKGGKGLEETLRLDLMDETTHSYWDADVLVFNTGHWWTHEKTSKGKDYYQEGNFVYPLLNVMEAYKKALTTWARWTDKNINTKKTRVFFRGYSVTHFSGGRWNSGGQCHKETEPIFNESYLGKYPSKMRTLEQVMKQMKSPVVYLNISKLSDYRKDGHPSVYRKVYQTDQQSQDCSHWCLPGIPDTWNELLYASLVMDGQESRTH